MSLTINLVGGKLTKLWVLIYDTYVAVKAMMFEFAT
jgi:hypothetical protein